MLYFLKDFVCYFFLILVIRNNMFDFVLLSNKSVVFVLANDSEECQPISIQYTSYVFTLRLAAADVTITLIIIYG